MATRTTRLTAASVLTAALAALVLAALAYGQSAVSTRTLTVSGTVVPSAVLAALDPAAEPAVCAGAVKITTKAVSDPTMKPGVVVSVDAAALSCVGKSTRGRYVGQGLANVTRLLVPNDVVQTTFALYKDAPGGFLQARTAVLTLNLSYDTTTGALTGATASLGSLP